MQPPCRRASVVFFCIATLLPSLACLVGCRSGDPSIPLGPHQGVHIDVKAYHKVEPSALFAFGFGGADGFEGEDDHPVSILFRLEPDAQKFRLLEAPIDAHGRDLSAFVVTPVAFREKFGSAFGEFVTDQGKDRYQYRVACERGGELLVSDPIPSRVKAAPTAFAPEALSFDPAGVKFSWEKAPEAARYFVCVTDERNRFCGGATTRARLWMFGEPVGAQTWFRPEIVLSGLVKGQRYRAELFALGEDGWAVSISDLLFTR